MIPRLNLGAIGKSTLTPNIPGMRFNGYVKTPRGTGRVNIFDTKYGFPTENRASTARTAKSNAVSYTKNHTHSNSYHFPNNSPFLILFNTFLFLLIQTKQSARMAATILTAQASANERAETARTAEPIAEVKPWEKDESETFVYYAYYQETVPESREENNRYRCFAIRCFSFDSTIQVTEVKRANSGITQGDFIKRTKVARSTAGGKNVFSSTASSIMGGPASTGFYTVDDFTVGTTINLYGRQFQVCGCDTKTRNYLSTQGKVVAPNVDFPINTFDNMAMGQGVHNWKQNWEESGGSFACKDSFIKRYVEAR